MLCCVGLDTLNNFQPGIHPLIRRRPRIPLHLLPRFSKVLHSLRLGFPPVELFCALLYPAKASLRASTFSNLNVQLHGLKLSTTFDLKLMLPLCFK